MPPPTRRGSRAAVATVFEDLEADIDATARRFAKQYHQRDVEDIRADARLHFLEAYNGFDRTRSRIEQRVVSIVWNRLVDRVRVCAKRSSKAAVLLVSDVAPDGGFDAPDRAPPLDREAFFSQLSEDAELVVRLLIDTPAQLADAYPLLDLAVPDYASVVGVLSAPDYAMNPQTVKGLLAGVLRALLWTPARVREAFAEVAAALCPPRRKS